VRGRLELIRAVREAGLPCGVMVAPVLPWMTDSASQLDDLLGQLAEAGATGVTTLVLHLRPGVKEWFMGWLGQERPDLVKRYEDLYARGTNASPSFRRAFEDKVRPLLDKHGFGSSSRHRSSHDPVTPSSQLGIVEVPGQGSESGWGEPDPTHDRFRGPRKRRAPVPAITPDLNQDTLF
jgi:hypothetical protein